MIPERAWTALRVDATRAAVWSCERRCDEESESFISLLL